MNVPSRIYGALSRALTPPRGDADAFAVLRLSRPDTAELEAEHAELFGRAGHAALSPYAAVRTRTGLHAVREAFASVGFAPDPGFRDRPDHVCIWLAVLEGLARDAEAAAEAGGADTPRRAPKVLRRFVRQHAEPWLPAFFLEMALLPAFPLHRALAHQANEFLLGGRVPRRASSRDAQPRRPSEEVICTDCGKPMGLLKPDSTRKAPPWGSTCVRCRLRADLRRSAS